MIRLADPSSCPDEENGPLPALRQELAACELEPYPFSSACSPVQSEQVVSAKNLKRRIMNFLASRDRASLQQLQVDVQGGVVVLRGRVRSYREKQFIHHCCSRVAGVLRVVDGLHVVPEPSELRGSY